MALERDSVKPASKPLARFLPSFSFSSLSKWANKRGGGGQKSQKCAEGREEEVEFSGESADDDEIRVEKIVLSPARKKTKKSSNATNH